MPGIRESRLVYSQALNSWASKEDKKKLKPVFQQIGALLAHGLSAIDLVRCWVGWQVQPLSVRTQIMCEYSGPGDDMRFSQVVLEPAEVVRATKRLLGESMETIGRIGLAPFWTKNPVPQVRIIITFIFFCTFWEKGLTICIGRLVCRPQTLGG